MAFPAAFLLTLLSLGGCHALSPVKTSDAIDPFATVEPLDNGAVFLEVDPQAHRSDGAVMRVNDRAWSTEAIVRRGDRIEIAYRESPRAGQLAYGLLGHSPSGRIYFQTSRWFDDGFPAQTRRLAVWPYRDGRQTARAR